MKRIFIILCLITICNISYADIASVGYVDSVVNSLPTVAKTGSYNDLSNKPTIPNIPTGPSGGRYNLVWNGDTGSFMFELVPGSCPSGTYDIGFDQCIDPTIGGTSFTRDVAAMTWKTVFPYGNVSGIAVCNDTSGSYAVSSTTEQVETGGKYCWCKMTHPATSNWVFSYERSSSSFCADNCANDCGRDVQNQNYSGFRSGVFSSVGK